MYINTKSATTTDTTDKTDKTDSHVKTGDTANLKLTFVLMFVSVVGAVYVLSMKKKRC
ncbi:MAG: LPXTG cell wall anchor domain-containing protein [Lachnospiraceae bacterium]|nr:LPXTG cell wall anchor domain-containing protein [Lachnospiraceae bacterium]